MNAIAGTIMALTAAFLFWKSWMILGFIAAFIAAMMLGG